MGSVELVRYPSQGKTHPKDYMEKHTALAWGFGSIFRKLLKTSIIIIMWCFDYLLDVPCRCVSPSAVQKASLCTGMWEVTSSRDSASFSTGRFQQTQAGGLPGAPLCSPLSAARNGSCRKNGDFIREHHTGQGTRISTMHPPAAQHPTMKPTGEKRDRPAWKDPGHFKKIRPEL